MNREPLISLHDVFTAFVGLLVLLSLGLVVAFGGLGSDFRDVFVRPQSPDDRFKSEARDWLTVHAPGSKLIELIRPMQGPEGRVSLAKIQTRGANGEEAEASFLFHVADSGSILTTDKVDGEAEKKALGIVTLPSSQSQTSAGQQ